MTRRIWRRQTSYVKVDIVASLKVFHKNFECDRERLFAKGRT